MRKTILFFLLFISYVLSAQTNRVIVIGKVMDVLYKPIPYATVQTLGTLDGASADFKGHYIFKTTLPGTLKASYLGYKTAFRKISTRGNKDTINIDFVLTTDSAQLQQVLITATHEPVLIRESGSLIDFDISNGNLLLLYEHSHGDQILAYDAGMRKLNTTQLKYHADNFQRDERFDIYYAHRDSLHFLYYNPATTAFEQFSLSQDYFNSFKPVLAYNSPYYYYGEKLEMNAGVQYAFYNSKNKEQRIFYSYFNNNILRQNMEREEDMEELKMKAANLWMVNGGIKARTFEGSLHNLIALGSDFYSQISVVNDSIYIFNFNNDSINVYDNQNNLKRKLLILFEWMLPAISKKEIITDDDKKECYYKYEKDNITYLEKIDLNSGKAFDLQAIKYPYIEKLRIYEGNAYFTTTSGGGADEFVRHFYRQRIN